MACVRGGQLNLLEGREEGGTGEKGLTHDSAVEPQCRQDQPSRGWAGVSALCCPPPGPCDPLPSCIQSPFGNAMSEGPSLT